MAALHVCLLRSIHAAWCALRAMISATEVVLRLLMNIAALCVTLLFSLPLVGLVLHGYLRSCQLLVRGCFLPLEAVLLLCGVKGEKQLRIRIVILRGENGDAPCREADLLPQLIYAIRLYKEQANVAIVPVGSASRRISADRPDVISRSYFVVEDAITGIDFSGSRRRGMLGKGRVLLNLKCCRWCFWAQWRRILGYGAPVTAFITTRGDGHLLGWHLLPAEYVILRFRPEMRQGAYAALLAHELGHVCDLGHRKKPNNLMNRNLKPLSDSELRLTWDQVLALRVSPHVSRF